MYKWMITGGDEGERRRSSVLFLRLIHKKEEVNKLKFTTKQKQKQQSVSLFPRIISFFLKIHIINKYRIINSK